VNLVIAVRGIGICVKQKSRSNLSGYLCYPHENTHIYTICKRCAKSN